MNGKTTLWLCATAVALLAFIYLFERRLPSRIGAAPAPTPLLAGFDPRLIESVEFSHSNSLVRAERTNEQWLLTAPVRYPANKVAIENLLSSIALLRRQTILSADEILSRPGAVAEFGIDPPRATLLLRAGRDRKEFLLGSATPPGTHLYYQFIGAPGIFLAPEGFWRHLPASVDDWRDAAFVDLRGARFNRVRIRFADLGFELVRAETNQLWSITEPVASRADDVQVAALLRQIEQLEVRHFVPPPYPRLEPFGLDPPALTVSFGRGTNDLFHVYFGRSPTNEPGLVFARRSDYTNIVLVDNKLAGPLRAGYTAFRDRQLLPFDPALVDRIEVEAAERFAFLRETNRWRLADPPGFPADPELVSAFFERLRRLRIADFEKEVVTDFTVYGLAPPARRYTLRFAGNTNAVAQIDLGTNRNGHVFARRNQETAVFTIPLPSAEDLPRAAYELRDRVLWRIVPTNIVRLALIERGQTRTFTRNAAGEWSVPPEFKLPFNHFAIEDVAEQLGQLRADVWVPPVPSRDLLYERLGFREVDRKLTFAAVIDQKTESFVIEFGRATPARSLYAAVTLEGQRVIFEFPLLLAQMMADYLTPLVPAGAR